MLWRCPHGAAGDRCERRATSARWRRTRQADTWCGETKMRGYRSAPMRVTAAAVAWNAERLVQADDRRQRSWLRL